MQYDPNHWDTGVEGYARFADDCTALFVEDLLRLAPASKRGRCLDLASGTGVVALAAAGTGASVDAVDFSPGMVRHLTDAARAAGFETLRTSVQDGQRLEFTDGTFDVVWSLFGLVLFEDPERGLAECHRVLAPGGRVAIGAWSARQDAGRVLVEAMRRALPDRPPPAERPPFMRLGDRRALGAALSDAGFLTIAIVSVRRPWILASAEAFWRDLASFSPTAAAGLDTLTDVERATLGGQVVHDLGLRFGNGPVALEADALLAVGRKSDSS